MGRFVGGLVAVVVVAFLVLGGFLYITINERDAVMAERDAAITERNVAQTELGEVKMDLTMVTAERDAAQRELSVVKAERDTAVEDAGQLCDVNERLLDTGLELCNKYD